MAVLKPSERGIARPLQAPAIPAAIDEAARLRTELAEVRAAAARAAETAKAAIAAARVEGITEGRAAGIASVERSERERLTLLAKGLADARDQLSKRLTALDGLAAALARMCLARVFARPEAMAAMVCDALSHRLTLLRDRTDLTIRVSGADFADPAALAAIGAAVTIDPDLPSGACRMTMRLDRIDLDLPGQWATIAQALDDMAAS